MLPTGVCGLETLVACQGAKAGDATVRTAASCMRSYRAVQPFPYPRRSASVELWSCHGLPPQSSPHACISSATQLDHSPSPPLCAVHKMRSECSACANLTRELGQAVRSRKQLRVCTPLHDPLGAESFTLCARLCRGSSCLHESHRISTRTHWGLPALRADFSIRRRWL